MKHVLVALGANLPRDGSPPASTLEEAVHAISNVPGVTLSRQSRYYRTPAWPPGSGPDFINAAIAVETIRTPADFLQELHVIEAQLGRERPVRWAPRVCDLDLIGWGDMVLPDAQTARRWMALDDATARTDAPDQLILPHPRMHERAFVLVPLNDVAPAWNHPLLDRTVAEICGSLTESVRAEIVPID